MKALFLKKTGVILGLLFVLALTLNRNPVVRSSPISPPAKAVKARSEKNGSAAEESPRLVIDSEVHDFGEIWSGETIKHVFVLENKGGSNLEIKRVSPG